MNSIMLPTFLSIIFGTVWIVFTVHGISFYNYQSKSPRHLEHTDGTPANNIGDAKCESLALCFLLKPKVTTSNFENDRAQRSIPLQRSASTAVQPKSYYNYGSNTSPAFYPAFDTLSVLTSLAFLAFVLQSFASLFDRSRSIIPAIVNHRSSSLQYEPPDPIKLVIRALDEYDIFSNNIILNNEIKQQKILS